MSLRAGMSNFSAASTSASAACCGVLNIFALTVVDAGLALAVDCCRATSVDVDSNAHAMVTTAERSLRLGFPRLCFISMLFQQFFPSSAYLRRPPPPRPPPKPPPRDPMLEAPRLLLARALDPLYPREPLEPPPKASRFPPPPRVRSRPPMLFGPPPDRLPPSPPPARLLTPASARLLARLPPCRPSCCLAPA